MKRLVTLTEQQHRQLIARYKTEKNVHLRVLRYFYQSFAKFSGAIDAFFANLAEHRDALATLMTENLEFIKCR